MRLYALLDGVAVDDGERRVFRGRDSPVAYPEVAVVCPGPFARAALSQGWTSNVLCEAIALQLYMVARCREGARLRCPEKRAGGERERERDGKQRQQLQEAAHLDRVKRVDLQQLKVGEKKRKTKAK